MNSPLPPQESAGKPSAPDIGEADVFKIAVVCGGPSLERGISLNSARSLLDHLSDQTIRVIPFYVDQGLSFYRLSPAQLYSNTPSDFDFKLRQTAVPLDQASAIEAMQDCDLVFPCIHGAFGEDGQLQQLLENHQIPFVGSPSAVCRIMANKFDAAAYLGMHGYATLPALRVRSDDLGWEKRIENFFLTHALMRAVVKPAAGGSSIGVNSVASVEDACACVRALLFQEPEREALIEPFCSGVEFTVVVLEAPDGYPVALPPTSVDMDYSSHQIFDTRRKYLPTANTQYHCPPLFPDHLVSAIRGLAEDIFRLFGMRDMVRLDGWLSDRNEILFTDLNPISGMEQNSFIFQQASRIGLAHRDLLRYIVANACRRYGLELPRAIPSLGDKSRVRVLFGGCTAERQVSLMSGTNVWLKLRRSTNYTAEPYLLDEADHIWHLPYDYCLNHTVEEIRAHCGEAEYRRGRITELASAIRVRLLGGDSQPFVHELPRRISLQDFCAEAHAEKAFVFLALHGGMGEDGTIQSVLDSYSLRYNGSGRDASRICMDKLTTGRMIEECHDPQLVTSKRRLVRTEDVAGSSEAEFQKLWASYEAQLGSGSLLVKPRADGCSAGIVRLASAHEFETYFELVGRGVTEAKEGTFRFQTGVIEMNSNRDDGYLIEPFIGTDHLEIAGAELRRLVVGGWLELTVGVIEQDGLYHAFSPSITVKEGTVLSLEEKFQGGTGINITPPPDEIVSATQVALIKDKIESAARALKIQNYARLDVFFNTKTNIVMLIEANSLPGLTGSTVIFQQALAEQPPLFPTEFLEHIIATKCLNQNNRTGRIKSEGG